MLARTSHTSSAEPLRVNSATNSVGEAGDVDFFVVGNDDEYAGSAECSILPIAATQSAGA